MPVQISNSSPKPARPQKAAAQERNLTPILIGLVAIAVLAVAFMLWRTLGSGSGQMDANTVQQHMSAKLSKPGYGGMPLGVGPGASSGPAGGARPAVPGQQAGRPLK